MNTKKIIEFWYKKIGFPDRYDKEFYQALDEIEITGDLSIENYDLNDQDGKRNLLSFLYFCEALKKKYEEKGISEDILLDTLSDLVIWTDIWSEIKGELYLGELNWLKFHFGMKIFKLGRLQFSMGKAPLDVPSANISKGDNVMEIHIPATGSLKNELCLKSIEAAKEFFEKYYPEYEYKYFSCYSWLIDTSLKEILDSSSNIIQFQNMFDVVYEEKSDAILKYTFRWDMKRSGLKDISCKPGFTERIKNHILAGKDFNESYGIIKK